MVAYTFQQQFDEKKMVRAAGRNLNMSRKDGYAIADFIKGKPVNRMIAYLSEVSILRQAIPFPGYWSYGHRRGKLGPGRFPVNASLLVKGILEGLKKNAEVKGLDSENLVIVHASGNAGSRIKHSGRRYRERKNSHFEVVAKEGEKTTKKEKQTSKPKTEAKQSKPINKASTEVKSQ